MDKWRGGTRKSMQADSGLEEKVAGADGFHKTEQQVDAADADALGGGTELIDIDESKEGKEDNNEHHWQRRRRGRWGAKGGEREIGFDNVHEEIEELHEHAIKESQLPDPRLYNCE